MKEIREEMSASSKRYWRIRNARAKGIHTKQEWDELLNIFDYSCARCGSSDDGIQKDHIIPIYQGGSDSLKNIQPLCMSCNSAKGPESFDWKSYRISGGTYFLTGSGKKEQEEFDRMPKRFTSTEKWIDPWFCKLGSMDKMFWLYLLDNCNHSGIWQVNWPLVQFHFQAEFLFHEELFKSRIVVVSEEKWFIPKFIKYQYGELRPDNRVHQSVISELTKEGVYKDLNRPFIGHKDKDKVLDKDKVKDKSKVVVGAGK